MKYEKILNFFFISIAVSIPLWMLVNNIAIIALLLSAIVYFIIHYTENRLWKPIYSVFVFLYLLMFLALFYTNNLDEGLKKIEQRTLFLIIPLICYLLSPFITNKLIFKIIKWFIASVFFASLIFFVNAILRTIYFASPNPFNEINGNFFSYFEFTKVIDDIHPIYYGTQVLFSIFIIIYDGIENKGVFKIKIAIRIMVIIYFVVVLFLLNSFLLSGLFLLMILYFVLSFKKNIKLKFVLAMVLVIAITLPSYFVINKLKGIDLKNDIAIRDFSGNDFTAVKARVAKYYCSMDLISDNMYLGVSPGDANLKLNEYYEKNNFKHGVINNFNSHNQFLTEYIWTGLLGFCTLLYLFFFTFKEAINNKNKILLALTFICFAFNLTESSLVRNKGIVFFVFFVCLLTNLKTTENIAK